MIDDLWYKNAVIYCLDVAKYVDANGDGVGDFAGLTRRLDYLAGLGVTCIWLQPFYPSPNRDNGYDVSQHYGIDPKAGTFGELVEFMNHAEQLGLRGGIAVVGASGALVTASRLDHGGPGGMARARSKAWISATQQIPSAEHLQRMTHLPAPISTGSRGSPPIGRAPDAARATSSLPVPVSPMISTVLFVSATSSALRITSSIARLRPTMP